MTDYNATLWVIRDKRVLVCLRVYGDAAGRVMASSVADFNQLDPKTGFDHALRKKLLERYGEQCEILVHVDGGAGFERFRRGLLPERPTPPQGPTKPQQLGF